MHYHVLLHILQGRHNLQRKVLRFKFMDLFPFFNHLQQRLVRTKLKYDVNVFFIVEIIVKLADILVFNPPVDFKFRHQLRLVPCVVQGDFLDDFDRNVGLGRCVLTLPTSGERTLAQLGDLAEENRLFGFAELVLENGLNDVGVLLLGHHNQSIN